ncbi:unnamed protein product [Mesocestoides corti]|uniref:PKD domain-containing protein n=2 Tax=Mesocestoides corti TaxID=53468 RepID=A0A0R3UBB5_MESCO|nr:unnamed protein product [Mesocestoides corti]
MMTDTQFKLRPKPIALSSCSLYLQKLLRGVHRDSGKPSKFTEMYQQNTFEVFCMAKLLLSFDITILLLAVLRLHVHATALPSAEEVRRGAFDFGAAFECPEEVNVDEIFTCQLLVSRGTHIRAVVQWQGQPPFVHEFTETNTETIGLVSLDDGLNEENMTCSSNTKLPINNGALHEGELVSLRISSRGGEVSIYLQRYVCAEFEIADILEATCYNKKKATAKNIEVMQVMTSSTQITEVTLQPPWTVQQNDRLYFGPSDVLNCVTSANRAPDKSGFLESTSSIPAVSATLLLPNRVKFTSKFSSPGIYSVIVLLEPYAWSQQAPSRRLQQVVRVIGPPREEPLTLYPTTSAASTTQDLPAEVRATYQEFGPIPGFDVTFDTNTPKRLLFSVTADTTFHGSLEMTGSNFEGVFKHTCTQQSGACVGEVTGRVIRTGSHMVCVDGVTDAHQKANVCKAVCVVGPLGSIELYIDQATAMVNKETILRTRPLTGDYDPRLNYSLDFGDGSGRVTGEKLDERVVFRHIYRKPGSFEAILLFDSGDRFKLLVVADYAIEDFTYSLPNGNTTNVGGSLNVTASFRCPAPVRINLVSLDGTVVFEGTGTVCVFVRSV